MQPGARATFQVSAARTHRGALVCCVQCRPRPALVCWWECPAACGQLGAPGSKAGEGAVQLWAGMSRVFVAQNWGSEWPFCRQHPHKSPSWIQCPVPRSLGPRDP